MRKQFFNTIWYTLLTLAMYLLATGEVKPSEMYILCKLEQKKDGLNIVPVSVPLKKAKCEKLKHNNQKLICVQEVQTVDVREVEFDGKVWVEK